MVNPGMKATFQILAVSIPIMIICGALLFNFYQQSSAQIGSMATLQNIAATYGVSIIPGAAQRTSPYHYFPPAIAVPTGTTVAWFNNDFGQPHTVTSGVPGAPNNIFNSGLMPATANSFFQYTFDRRGDFTYYCMIHPWRLAIVSVNSAKVEGKNFEFSSGVGPTWNLTKDFRTLVDFTPSTISLDQSTPIVYNVTILKNNTEKVFSRTFVTNGEALPIELIKGGNETRAYGPDFSSTGAYHMEGAFFKDNADYKILISISSVNSKPPPYPIADEFTIKTVSSP